MSKKIEKTLFLFNSSNIRILGASSDLCAYLDWEFIQTWALMRNVSPTLCAYLSMGAYLSPGHFIGNLRYFSIVARPLKSLSANLSALCGYCYKLSS